MFGVHRNVMDVDSAYNASADASIWSTDAYQPNVNGSSDWNGLLDLDIPALPFQEGPLDGQISTEAFSMTGIANRTDQTRFMNPWTQEYEQLSIDDTGSSPAQSNPPKKTTVSRKSERRKAQNRAAQRKFTARKLEYENNLVDRIAEMERTISRLGSENMELKMILEDLKRPKRTSCVQNTSGEDARNRRGNNHGKRVERGTAGVLGGIWSEEGVK